MIFYVINIINKSKGKQGAQDAGSVSAAPGPELKSVKLKSLDAGPLVDVDSCHRCSKITKKCSEMRSLLV